MRNEKSRPNYLRILRKFESQEELLIKDLYDFDESDLIEILCKSYFNKDQLQVVYKAYVKWGMGHFERTLEHKRAIALGQLIKDNALDTTWTKLRLAKIFTRTDLTETIIPRIFPDDYISKAIILLAFEVIGNEEELLGLRIDAIDGKWLTTPKGRKISRHDRRGY